MTETLPSEEKAIEESLGAFLSGVRQEKGISIEQAAHDTRIRPQRLREMESDDFSHFSHPSYSRMFLMDYAKYLGVPLAKIRHFLPEGGACGAAGYDYLQNLPEKEVPVPRVHRPFQRRGPMPAIVGGFAVIVLGLLAFKGWMTLRDISRLDLKGDKVTASATAPDGSQAAAMQAFEPPAVTTEVKETVVVQQTTEVVETEDELIAGAEVASDPEAFTPPAITISPGSATTAAAAPAAPAPATPTAPALDDHAILFVDGAHSQDNSVRQ